MPSVTLGDILVGLNAVELSGSPEIEITSLAYDSRDVQPGSLFIAVKGYKTDGNQYIKAAEKAGADVIVTDDATAKISCARVLVPDARKTMAHIADIFYGSPQKRLVMGGITGTNGKTTTSYMLKSIFDAAGMGCGVIGTIGHIVGDEFIESKNTTPEAPDIHDYLAQMADSGQTACAMEVSSHALSLSRVYGVSFRTAAFLNLTHDHLDFHGNFDKYLEAKALLFADLAGDSTAVVNGDDPYASYILDVARNVKTLTFGEKGDCDIRPLKIDLKATHTDALIVTPAGELNITLPVPGRYNIWNAMAAAGMALASGLPIDVISRGLNSMPQVRGRYEIVNEGQPFAVIVDYAHTPDALERVLMSARELTTGRLISVFGCGGDRDKTKRAVMGGISTKIADQSFVTSDNPRTEDPGLIIENILEGVSSDSVCESISDREIAIAAAIRFAEAGDTIVIAGKGHEDYQIIGSEKRHFDDAETARRYLKELS